MKRIGIDARLINQTGVGTYIRNLLHELSIIAPHTVEVLVFTGNENGHIVKKLIPQAQCIKAQQKWHTLSEQTSFLSLLHSSKLDLMHFTYFSFPYGYNKPFVITIHDITPLLLPTGKASTKHQLEYSVKYLAYKALLTKAIRSAKAILVPTQSVKDSILQHFGDAVSPRIFVTYEGISNSLLTSQPKKPALPKEAQSFYLYVGNFYPHKNIETLVHAFKEAKIGSHLVLIGPNDYFAGRIKHIVKSAELDDQVEFLHDVSHDELAYLYIHAKALIHPSKAEGFGLPLLEASYFGCPVIASDIPVYHEIMGDACDFFDPNDMYSLARVIQKFDEKPHKATLKRDEILKNFSFSNMALQTLDIYNSHI